MGSPFIQSALENLSRTLAAQAEEKRLKEQEDEKREQSVYEHLLTHRDPAVKEIGLAALLEKPKTKRKGFLGLGGSERVSPARDTAKAYIAQLQKQDEEKKKAEIAPPPSYAPPTGTAAMSTQSVDTGDGINMTPAASMEGSPPSEPDLGPPPSMQPTASPAATAGPPSFADFSSRYQALQDKRQKEWEAQHPWEKPGEVYKPDPILQQADYTAAAGLSPEQTQENLQSVAAPTAFKVGASKAQKENDWAHKAAQDAARHGMRVEENELKNTRPVSKWEAERFGLPENSRFDDRALAQLHADTRAMNANQIKLAVAKMVQDGGIVKVATTDADGDPISVYMRKGEALNQSFEQPATVLERNRAGQGRIIVKRLDEAIKLIQDSPEMGVIAGRINKGLIKLGDAPPAARAIHAALSSGADLQPYLHAARGVEYAKRFDEVMGGLESNPAGTIAAIEELKKTAQDVSDEARPKGPSKRTATSNSPPALPLPSDPKLLKKGQQYMMKDGSVGTYNGVDGFD